MPEVVCFAAEPLTVATQVVTPDVVESRDNDVVLHAIEGEAGYLGEIHAVAFTGLGGDDVALVEGAVAVMRPAAWGANQQVGHGVGVGVAETAQHGVPLVCLAVVVGVLEEKHLGAVGNKGAVLVGEEALGDR